MKTTEVKAIPMYEGGPEIDCKIEIDTEARTIKFTPFWFDLITVPSDAYYPPKPLYLITS